MNASISFDSLRVHDHDLDARLERDGLRNRVRVLEAALVCIGREAELPLTCPETSFIAVHRIASVARQTLERKPLAAAASTRSSRPPLARSGP